MFRLFVTCTLAGCWSNPKPAPSAPTAPVAALPACAIHLAEDGHLVVGAIDLGEFAPDMVDGRTLSIFQTGSTAHVAYRDPETVWGAVTGTNALWHVACDGKKLETYTEPSADFGHAALHPDRRRLFYSGAGVVRVLDLTTRKTMAITTGGKTDHCWENGPAKLSDIVRGVTQDHVEFSRGGPCGFEAEYTSTLLRKHLETGVEETATEITSIAKVGAAVWIAAGSGCRMAIYASTDWRTWAKVKGVDAMAPTAIVVDKDTITVASTTCSAVQSPPPLRVSRDGGRTWADEEDEAPGSRPARLVEATIAGRAVRLTSFGLYDARTNERLYPR